MNEPQVMVHDACAGVGLHLNQSTNGEEPELLASPAKVSVVTVTFVNTGGSDGRLKIAQHASNPDEGVAEYCYSANNENGTLAIKANQFTTKCWDANDSGLIGDGTGAQSFEIIIPSRWTVVTPFDVCIQHLSIK